MNEGFKIFIDRLRGGSIEVINEEFSSDFIDVHDEDLDFKTTVSIRGEASLVDETLILQFTARTEASMPCAICNESIQTEILVSEFRYTEEVENIPSGVFNYQQLLREALLLEIPHVAECNQGNCPERRSLEKFFTKKVVTKGHNPFLEL